MTKSIESKNSRININFKQDIINGKHLTTGFLSFNGNDNLIMLSIAV